MAITTNGLQLARIAGAVFNQHLSASDYSEILAANTTAAALDAWANAAVAAEFRNKTTTDIAKAVLANVGLSSVAGLEAWVAGQLNAGGGVAKAGASLLAMLNDYSNMSTTEAIYGASVVTFNAKTANSQALSQTAGTPTGTYAAVSIAAKSSSITLTTGTDNKTTGSGDDTFDAGINSSSLQTLNSGDRLDGGAGTDELIAVVNSTVTPTSIAGIENITVSNVSTTTVAVVDFTNATGIQNLTNQASTFGLTLSGISKTTNVTVRDTSAATQTVTYSDVSGTADSATVKVQNLSGSASLVVAGVETLTLNSLGTVSNVVGLTATSTKTLNVTGAAGVTLGTLGTTINSVDASLNTGTLANGISLTTAAIGTTTVIGAAGNDSLTLGASTGADSVSAGDGNDTVIFTANFTTADSVDGGNGSTDTLTLYTVTDAVTASAAVPTTYKVTGFETITVGGVGATYGTGLASGGSITAANISATATTLNIATTGATATYDVLVGAGTVVGPAGSFTLGLGGSVASNTAKLLGALTVTDTGAAITDSITIKNNAATGTGTANYSVWNGQNIVSSGYETVTLTSGSTAGGVANAFGTVTVTGDTGGTTAETVNFSGANIVTVGVITADIVDASGLTATGTSAAPTITMTTASTATKVTGSAGIDVLFGAASSASSVYGGAGNDTINGGTGNDVLLGETGDDTLIGSTGNDSIDGGTGNDRVETGSGLAAGDTITGGDGTDTLAITSDVTDNASGMSAVSGFEVLEIASGGTDTITMSNFTNSQTFTRVDYAENTGGTVTVDNVPTSVTDIRILAGASADMLVFDRLIDNSTNSVTISSRTGANTAITALTANDEETINFSGLTAADDLTLTNFTATDLKTLNITGDADFVVTVGNAISSTLLATLDASASTGAVTVTNTSNAVQATVTGGTGILTYNGGAAADSISGGSSGDFLNGGTGADTINGNAGNDSITGALGADVINVGSGTDTVNLGAAAATTTSTTLGTTATTTTSLAMTGSDVITGMGVGDKITYSTSGAGAFDGVAATTVGKMATAALMTALTVDNSANLMRGSWIADSTTGSGTFIYNTAGSDLMYAYDSDPTVGTMAFKSVVLVGVGGVVTGGTHTHSAGEITVTLT